MAIKYLDESGSIENAPAKSKIQYVDEEIPQTNTVVEPQDGVGQRVRGDLADLGTRASSPGDVASFLAEKGLARAPQELGADLLDSIMKASPELAQATAESIDANPAVDVIPNVIEAQQRSEGVRSSIVMGMDDAAKALMDAQTTINLFSEQGRKENVDRLSGIAKNTLEGVVGGVTGTEKRQFGEELKKRGVPARLASIVGFGMEMATDPLTYFTGGSIKAAEKLKAERLVAEADRITPDNVVASSMNFITNPAKNPDVYAGQIKRVKDELLKLNELRETLPKDIVADKSSKLLQELSDLRVNLVQSEAVDFANNRMKRTPRFFSLISSYLGERGQFGAAIARQLERADKTLNLYRAKWISRFESTGNLDRVFGAMNQDQRLNFIASLEGFEKPNSPLVQKAYEIADLNRRDIAKGAVSRGVVVRVLNKDGKLIETKPFVSRQNYFPHQIISAKRAFKDPKELADALEYSVRTGKFENIEEAKEVFGAYAKATSQHIPPSSEPVKEIFETTTKLTGSLRSGLHAQAVQFKSSDDFIKNFNAQKNAEGFDVNISDSDLIKVWKQAKKEVKKITKTTVTAPGLSVKANKENQAFFNWIVKTGQAKDVPEAVQKFNSHMNRISVPTNQSLELQRTIDIPFYDVDPTRVLTRYYSGAAKKFGELDHFGGKNEILNSLLDSTHKDMVDRGIVDANKDITTMRDMIDLVTGVKKPSEYGVSGFSRIVRNLEAASSLTFAFVMNATQTMNTASVVGFKNTVDAFMQAMTKAGQEYAFKSGAVFNEFTQSMYGINSESMTGRLARAVMENLTPFQAIERNNRVVTAIAAKNYVDELAGRLLAGKGKTYGAVDAAESLRKMDIRPEKVLAKNGVDLEDYLKASQDIGTRTQFRSRIQDVPEWASSDWGKIAFQFKTFTTQQWRFMRNEIYREAKSGNFAPMMRYAVLAPVIGTTSREVKGVTKSIVKTVASSFDPASGFYSPETLANMVKIASENKLNTDTDLENLAGAVSDVGAFGMLFDVYRSFEYKGAGWLSGLSPALGDVGNIGAAVYEAAQPLVGNFMGEEDARLLNLKPIVKTIAPRLPVLSFARSSVTAALMTDEDKRRRATQYLQEAFSKELPQDRIDDIKDGLKEKYDLSSRQLRKSERSAKKSIKNEKKAFRKESKKASDNPLAAFGF